MPTLSRAPSAVALAAALAIAAGCRGNAGSDPVRGAGAGGDTPDAQRVALERVVFGTGDGWAIAGELRPAEPRPGEPGPAVILVHQLGSNRSEWGPLVARLQPTRGARVTTLAIDLRGHGESTSGPDGTTTWQSFGSDTRRWAGIVNDVRAAAEFLRRRPLPPTGLLIVGSSIGSSAALRYAAEDTNVAGVAMISPGVAYRGLDTLEPIANFAGTGRAALLLASDGDTASADAIAQLLRRTGGQAAVSSVVYEGTGAHGVSIGAAGVHPEMWQRVDEWIRVSSGVASP